MTSSSSGVIRTRDLSVMSGALSPTELRCPENGVLVPAVVPEAIEIARRPSVEQSAPRHYESRTPVSSCHSAGNIASGKQRIGVGGYVYSSAAHGAKLPRCACGENRPEMFAVLRRRGRLEYQHKCKACAVEAHRQWRAKPEGRAKMRAGVKASRARYPERARARSLLQAAVARGDVIPGPCYAAGPDCSGTIEGHHDDYAKPLEVIWSCRRHHRALDRRRRETITRRLWKQRAADFMALLALCDLLPPERGTPAGRGAEGHRVGRPSTNPPARRGR